MTVTTREKERERKKNEANRKFRRRSALQTDFVMGGARAETNDTHSQCCCLHQFLWFTSRGRSLDQCDAIEQYRRSNRFTITNWLKMNCCST